MTIDAAPEPGPPTDPAGRERRRAAGSRLAAATWRLPFVGDAGAATTGTIAGGASSQPRPDEPATVPVTARPPARWECPARMPAGAPRWRSTVRCRRHRHGRRTRHGRRRRLDADRTGGASRRRRPRPADRGVALGGPAPRDPRRRRRRRRSTARRTAARRLAEGGLRRGWHPAPTVGRRGTVRCSCVGARGRGGGGGRGGASAGAPARADQRRPHAARPARPGRLRPARGAVAGGRVHLGHLLDLCRACGTRPSCSPATTWRCRRSRSRRTRDLHERYRITPCPRWSWPTPTAWCGPTFLGPVTATDLWATRGRAARARHAARPTAATTGSTLTADGATGCGR